MKNMMDTLAEKIAEKKNPTVAGLDPRLSYLPDALKKIADSGKPAEAIELFNKAVIDAVCDVVPAVKIQSAFYEMFGADGVRAMEKTAEYAKSKGLVTMADVKRNDIGSTAEAYADAYFSSGLYDYITVNPYPGIDGVKPFIDKCEKCGTGIFVLARMSNPSAAEIQNMRLEGGSPLYMHIGGLIETWGRPYIGDSGYSFVGAVVGATNPDEAASLRKTFGSVFFLVPGYGAQGGKGKDAAASFDSNGGGAIVNNSRGIIAAYLTDKYKGMAFDEAARAAAVAMANDLRSALS